MRVEKVEKIIIDWKESELWNDFGKLIDEICSEVTDEVIEGMIDDLQKIMQDLEKYMGVECDKGYKLYL